MRKKINGLKRASVLGLSLLLIMQSPMAVMAAEQEGSLSDEGYVLAGISDPMNTAGELTIEEDPADDEGSSSGEEEIISEDISSEEQTVAEEETTREENNESVSSDESESETASSMSETEESSEKEEKTSLVSEAVAGQPEMLQETYEDGNFAIKVVSVTKKHYGRTDYLEWSANIYIRGENRISGGSITITPGDGMVMYNNPGLDYLYYDQCEDGAQEWVCEVRDGWTEDLSGQSIKWMTRPIQDDYWNTHDVPTCSVDARIGGDTSHVEVEAQSYRKDFIIDVTSTEKTDDKGTKYIEWKAVISRSPYSLAGTQIDFGTGVMYKDSETTYESFFDEEQSTYDDGNTEWYLVLKDTYTQSSFEITWRSYYDDWDQLMEDGFIENRINVKVQSNISPDGILSSTTKEAYHLFGKRVPSLIFRATDSGLGFKNCTFRITGDRSSFVGEVSGLDMKYYDIDTGEESPDGTIARGTWVTGDTGNLTFTDALVVGAEYQIEEIDTPVCYFPNRGTGQRFGKRYLGNLRYYADDIHGDIRYFGHNGNLIRIGHEINIYENDQAFLAIVYGNEGDNHSERLSGAVFDVFRMSGDEVDKDKALKIGTVTSNTDGYVPKPDDIDNWEPTGWYLVQVSAPEGYQPIEEVYDPLWDEGKICNRHIPGTIVICRPDIVTDSHIKETDIIKYAAFDKVECKPDNMVWDGNISKDSGECIIEEVFEWNKEFYIKETTDTSSMEGYTPDEKVHGPYVFNTSMSSGEDTLSSYPYTADIASMTIRVKLAEGEVPEPTKYTVTVKNGSGSGSYKKGASVKIKADESAQAFKEWTGVEGLTFTEGSAKTAEATFIMPEEPVTVTATYENGDLSLYVKESGELKLCTSKKMNVGMSLTLIPKYTNGNEYDKPAIWVSTDPDVASVDQSGNIIATGGGVTTVTVSSEDGPDSISASCRITVSEPASSVTLDRKSYSFGTGESVTLKAKILPFAAAQELNWTANNTNISIEVSDDTLSATITGIKQGNSTVTATARDGSGKRATCSFTIGNAVPDYTISGKGGATVLAAGKSLAMQVDWGGKDKTPKNAGLTWSVVNAADDSDASEIATISTKGVLTGLSEGTVRVIASSTANPSKPPAEKEITIYVPIKSVSLNMKSGTVSLADESNGLQLDAKVTAAISGETATGEILGEEPSVTWSVDSKYEQNLSVDPDTGLVRAESVVGKNIPVVATVRAFNGYEKKLTCKVTVVNANPLKSIKLSKKKLSIGEGNTAKLKATLNPVNPDGDTELIWESDNPNVEVDWDGTVIVNKYEEGKTKATITVKTVQEVSGGKNKPPKPLTASCKVTITPSVSSIKITNADTLINKGLKKGKSYKLKTKQILSQNKGKPATKGLIWSTSDKKIATVSSKGVIKAISPGTVTITVTSSDAKAFDEPPFVSATFNVYATVTKVQIDRNKLTLGTRANIQRYGKVNIASISPLDATDPSIEWKVNNTNVSLAAIQDDAAPDTGEYRSPGDSVTTRKGESLAVKAMKPGVVKLTGMTTDGSKKKVTCKITVKGCVTGLGLKTTTSKIGLGAVKETDTGKYESNLKPGGRLTINPIIEINGVSSASTLKADKTAYAAYKKYTDTTISYRSSDTSVATVSNAGQITVNSDAFDGQKVTIYAISDDGSRSASILITVTSFRP